MLNVTCKPYMLSVAMLNVVMLSVVAPKNLQASASGERSNLLHARENLIKKMLSPGVNAIKLRLRH